MGRGNGQDVTRIANASGVRDALGFEQTGIDPDPDLMGGDFYSSRVEGLAQDIIGRSGINDITLGEAPVDMTETDWRPTAAEGFHNGQIGETSPRDVRRLNEDQLGYLYGQAQEAGKSPLAVLMFGVDKNDQPLGPPEDFKEACQRSADELGVPVAEVNPNLIMTPQLSRFGAMIRDWTDMGGRSYGLYGPHGTGKNAFMDQIGATLGMAVVEMDFGEGFTVQDAIGATGLGPVQTSDGTWIQGTTEEQGKLTRLSTHKVIAVCNEVESQRNQLESLHNLLGARFGEPDRRFVTINSPSGNAMNIQADPDFALALTWNPGREDARLKEATMDRLLAMEFTYGSPEEEAEKVAKQLTARIGGKEGFLGRDVTVEDVLPDIKFAAVCREAYNQNELEYQMGFRKILQYSGIRLLQKQENKEDATATALECIKFAIAQNDTDENKVELLSRLAHEAYVDVIDNGGN